MASKAPPDDDLKDLTAMLESGSFADATVTCGDQTWKVHRCIMSHRCAWFAKAFGGNFAEAVTAKVKLEDHDAQQVDWMIKFIYAGQLSFIADLMTNDTTVHETCVKLFHVGDYFQLPRLTAAACKALEQHNRTMAAAYQRAVVAFRKTNTAALNEFHFFRFDSDYQSRFFEQAKVAFETHSASWEPLQEAFFHFFRCTRYFVLQDVNFHDHLDKVPNLALLILRRMGTCEYAFIDSYPSCCSECEKDILGDADGKDLFFQDSWVYLNLNESGYTESFGGTCSKCYKERDCEEETAI